MRRGNHWYPCFLHGILSQHALPGLPGDQFHHTHHKLGGKWLLSQRGSWFPKWKMTGNALARRYVRPSSGGHPSAWRGASLQLAGVQMALVLQQHPPLWEDAASTCKGRHLHSRMAAARVNGCKCTTICAHNRYSAGTKQCVPYMNHIENHD